MRKRETVVFSSWLDTLHRPGLDPSGNPFPSNLLMVWPTALKAKFSNVLGSPKPLTNSSIAATPSIPAASTDALKAASSAAADASFQFAFGSRSARLLRNGCVYLDIPRRLRSCWMIHPGSWMGAQGQSGLPTGLCFSPVAMIGV